MRVLWICNMVLNPFTEEFQIKKKPFGGWMESLLHELEKDENLKMGFCFPIFDEKRMRDGEFQGQSYFSFHGRAFSEGDAYSRKVRQDFMRAFQAFSPDVIQIWGTEFDHAYEAVEASRTLGMIDRVVVRMQGISRVIAQRMLQGIPQKYWHRHVGNPPSLLEEQAMFARSGEREASLLRHVQYICDKSVFGKFYAKSMSPNAHFTYCDNILRESFYEAAGTWEAKSCQPHSIFIAQAHYPMKGLHILLQAVALVRKTYPDAVLKVGGLNVFDLQGEGHEYGAEYGFVSYIHDLIHEFQMEDAVRFLGILDEAHMVHAYQSANVAVTPSLIENKANSICEAMMIGTPTIASFVDGNVDAIQHGWDGYLFPSGDALMLAGEIMEVFRDVDRSTRISREAVKTAMRRHEKKTIAKTYHALYQDIVRARALNH